MWFSQEISYQDINVSNTASLVSFWQHPLSCMGEGGRYRSRVLQRRGTSGLLLGGKPSSATALTLEPDMALFFSGFRVFSSLISFRVSLWPSSKSEFCKVCPLFIVAGFLGVALLPKYVNPLCFVALQGPALAWKRIVTFVLDN